MHSLNWAGFNDLHHTVINNSSLTADDIQKFNVDINQPDTLGVTPLHLACLTGDEDTVKTLLDLGADINTVGGKYKSTPLMTAARHRYSTIVKLLLASNKVEDINYQDSLGNSALRYAAYDKNHFETAKSIYDMLIEHGAINNET